MAQEDEPIAEPFQTERPVDLGDLHRMGISFGAQTHKTARCAMHANTDMKANK
jgi:hypothetical protein